MLLCSAASAGPSCGAQSALKRVGRPSVRPVPVNVSDRDSNVTATRMQLGKGGGGSGSHLKGRETVGNRSDIVPWAPPSNVRKMQSWSGSVAGSRVPFPASLDLSNGARSSSAAT